MFNGMLSGNFLENTNGVLKMESRFAPEDVSAFLQFLYSGHSDYLENESCKSTQ